MAGREVWSGEARSLSVTAIWGANFHGGACSSACGKVESGAMKKVGLARALSKLGYCSRSRAAELIAAGRVKWNGAVRRDPETPVHLGKNRIEIDGQPVASSSKIYIAMNKPRGVVTTASDEKGRETVYSFLPQNLP